MCVCLCFTSMVPVPTGSITVAGLFVRPVFTCHNVQPTPDRSLTAAGAHRVALASWAGLPWLSCPIPSCGSFSKSRAEDHGDCTVRRAKNAAAEALMLSRTRPHLLGTISRRGREPSGQVAKCCGSNFIQLMYVHITAISQCLSGSGVIIIGEVLDLFNCFTGVWRRGRAQRAHASELQVEWLGLRLTYWSRTNSTSSY